MTYSGARRDMVENLVRDHDIRSRRVLEALGRVPRHRFVDEALRHRAYGDDALPIGHGQTISKPSTVARMTEAVAPETTHRLLEVGTGSGYQAAVLGMLAERVYSIERIPALVLRARRLLHALGLVNVEARPGDGAAGWPEAAPFDGILVAAAAPTIPRALRTQLAVGGRLVIPVTAGSGQELRRLVRVGPDQWTDEILKPCRFVPLV